MRSRLTGICVFLIAVASLAMAATPQLGPVVVVAFENHPYSSVVGSSAMPYLNSLIAGGALAANYHQTAPGSVPDYFELTTGNTVSCCVSYVGPYSGNNLARVLNGGGKSWKIYAQTLPSPGYLGTGFYPYVKYHNPFAYFTDVVNSAQKNQIVPLSQLSADVATGILPDFSMIVPDNRHNAHDCPTGVTNCADADKLHAADLFLQDFIPALMNTPDFQKSGLLVIWWDEGNPSSSQTAITFVGPLVKAGYRSGVSYQDPNLLRTIIAGLGLASFPGASAAAADMGDMFAGSSTPPPPPPPTATGVNITSPAAGATVTDPVQFTATATPVSGRTIAAMRLYVDNVVLFQTSSGSLNTSLTLASGAHTVMVAAWDNTGALMQKVITISVGTSTPPPPPTATGVSITSPAAGASVANPVHFIAAATPTSGRSIVAMRIYVDNAVRFQTSTGSLDTSLTLTAGSRVIMIAAWDNTGALYQKVINITVQ
jgi:hypothetical protein